MAKTHVIDGKTYVEVERVADVGDYVYVPYDNEVFRVASSPFSSEEYALEGNRFVFKKYAYTLEPVASEAQPTLELTANDIRWQPGKVIDLLANLARRVSSLERQVDSLSSQLKDTQGNVERQGVEIAELEKLTESNEGDIRELDERTQVVNAIQKYYDGGAR